jgi:hypothetical protein
MPTPSHLYTKLGLGGFLTVVARTTTFHLPIPLARAATVKNRTRPSGLAVTPLQRIPNPGRSPGTNPDLRRSANDAVGSFQLPGSRPGVGGHARREWQTRTVTGIWGTRLGNILAMRAVVCRRQTAYLQEICRWSQPGSNRRPPACKFGCDDGGWCRLGAVGALERGWPFIDARW